MMIYLGGAIDLVSGETRNAWREKFAGILMSEYGISSFNPAAAFNFNVAGDAEDAEKLIEINRRAMLTCDLAVFVMASDQPSIGTPMELLMAKQEGLPHIVIWNPSIKSFDPLFIQAEPNMLPAYINGIADEIVYTFDGALAKITQIGAAVNTPNGFAGVSGLFDALFQNK